MSLDANTADHTRKVQKPEAAILFRVSFRSKSGICFFSGCFRVPQVVLHAGGFCPAYIFNNSRNLFVCVLLTGISDCFLSAIFSM